MADNDEAFTPETNPNIGGGEIVGPGGTGPYTPSSNDVRVKDTYAMAVRIKSQLDAINQTLATLQGIVNTLAGTVANIATLLKTDGAITNYDGTVVNSDGYILISDKYKFGTPLIVTNM